MQAANATEQQALNVLRARNTLPKCDKKIAIHLAKHLSLTLVLVFLAFISVSDGSLEASVGHTVSSIVK
jgi:hypothetical protein